jgi:hypothetical protein
MSWNKSCKIKLPNIQDHPKHLDQCLACTKCSQHTNYYCYNSVCSLSPLFLQDARRLSLNIFTQCLSQMLCISRRDGSSQTGPGKLCSQRSSSGHLAQLRCGLKRPQHNHFIPSVKDHFSLLINSILSKNTALEKSRVYLLSQGTKC